VWFILKKNLNGLLITLILEYWMVPQDWLLPSGSSHTNSVALGEAFTCASASAYTLPEVTGTDSRITHA
jgi:hypothetical protein